MLKNKSRYIVDTKFHHGSKHFMQYFEQICTLKNIENPEEKVKNDYTFSEKNIVKGYEDFSHKNLKCFDIINQNHKLFKTFQSNVYDILIKDIPEIVYALSMYPKSEIVLDLNAVKMTTESGWGIINSFVDFLKQKGIKVHVINMKELDVLYINNFSVIFFPFESGIKINLLNNFFNIKSNKAATKKVYFPINQNDSNIEIFQNAGFEIVPIQKLNTIKSFIKYFAKVRVLAAQDDLGLISAYFMPDQGVLINILKESESYNSDIVIEKEFIYDELENINSVNELKVFYNTLAFWKKHLYISYTTITEQIVNLLKNV